MFATAPATSSSARPWPKFPTVIYVFGLIGLSFLGILVGFVCTGPALILGLILWALVAFFTTYSCFQRQTYRHTQAEARFQALEKLRMIQDLQESEELYRTLVECVPDTITKIDPSGQILFVNRRTSGNDPANISKTTIFDYLDPDDIVACQDALVAVFQHGKTVLTEVRTITPPGKVRWFRTLIVPIHTDGSIATALAISTDITESRLEHEALQQSESRYRDLVETSNDLIWSVDLEGRWTFVNRKAAQRIYGFEPEEMLGRPFSDFLAKELQAHDLETHERIKSGEPVYQYETEHRRKDGTPVRLSFNAIPLCDGLGRVIGTTGTATDITQSKKIEEELLRQRQFIDRISALTPIVLYVFDLHEGRSIYLNGASLRLLGYSNEELTSMGANLMPNIMHPDDMLRMKSHLEAMTNLPEDTIREIEYRMRASDGQWHWMLSRDTPFSRNPDGRVHQIIGVAWEITDRKVADETLRANEAQLRSIIEIEPACVKLMSRDKTILRMNSSGLQMLEADSLEQVVGKNIDNLLVPEHRAAYDEMHTAVCNGESRNLEFEITGLKGTRRWLETRAVPIYFNPLGEIVHLSITQDITLHRQIQASLIQRAKLMEFGAAVGLALAQSITLQEALQKCTEAIIQILDGSFARIWTFNLECEVLELQGSAGVTTTGEDRLNRIPLGRFAMSNVAQQMQEDLTAAGGSACSFVGHPLQVEDRVVGVMAIFSQKPFDQATLETMAWVSIGIAENIHRRGIETQIRASLREKESLLKEVHHRVKNNLQIITSLLSLQASRLQDRQLLNVLTESQNRVRSMALVHENLYRSSDLARVNLAAHVESLCAHLYRSYGVDSNRVRLERRVDPGSMDLDHCIPCGLIINELVTNSLKYAFPDRRSGVIVVEMRRIGDEWLLRVADDGIGLPEGFNASLPHTLGLEIVRDLTLQLRGTLEVEKLPGATFTVRFRASPSRELE